MRGYNLSFIIIHRDENGKPVETYPGDTNVATYVSTSIMICREMLKDYTVQHALQILTKKLYPKQSENPYQDPRDVPWLFAKAITDDFPLVFVDYSMKNPDIMAESHRREWGGDGSSFESRNQSIVLNGPWIHSMCIAGRNAEEANDPNSDAPKRFRTFLFECAITMLHELAHVYVTFLRLDEMNTPPHISSSIKANKSPDISEAGWWLGELVLGGRMIVLRNTEEDEHKPDLIYLSGPKQGKKGTYQVLQKTIDDYVRLEFKFPIEPLDRPEALKLMGAGLPREEYAHGDPLNQLETKKPLEEHEARSQANPFTWGKEINDLMANNRADRAFTPEDERILKRVPDEPGLLLTKGRPRPAA